MFVSHRQNHKRYRISFRTTFHHTFLCLLLFCVFVEKSLNNPPLFLEYWIWSGSTRGTSTTALDNAWKPRHVNWKYRTSVTRDELSRDVPWVDTQGFPPGSTPWPLVTRRRREQRPTGRKEIGLFLLTSSFMWGRAPPRSKHNDGLRRLNAGSQKKHKKKIPLYFGHQLLLFLEEVRSWINFTVRRFILFLLLEKLTWFKEGRDGK